MVADALSDGRVLFREGGEEELNEGDVRYSVGQGAEGGGVEALNNERGRILGPGREERGGGGSHAEVFGLKDLNDLAFDVKAVEVEEVRFLDLRVDPHFPLHRSFGFADHVDDFVESRYLEKSIVRATPLAQPLLGPQRLNFRQREIKGEETLNGHKGGFASDEVARGNSRSEGDVAAPVCKFRAVRDVGGFGEVDVVTADLREERGEGGREGRMGGMGECGSVFKNETGSFSPHI